MAGVGCQTPLTSLSRGRKAAEPVPFHFPEPENKESSRVWPISSTHRACHQSGLNYTTGRPGNWGVFSCLLEKVQKLYQDRAHSMPRQRPRFFLCGYKHLEPFPSLGSTERGAQKGHRRKGGPEEAQNDELTGPGHS